MLNLDNIKFLDQLRREVRLEIQTLQNVTLLSVYLPYLNYHGFYLFTHRS